MSTVATTFISFEVRFLLSRTVKRVPSALLCLSVTGSGPQIEDTEKPPPIKGDESKDEDLVLKAGWDRMILTKKTD